MSLGKMLFNHTSVPLLTKALDAYALRHRAIASNIAHIATPGYRRREVHFEEELREALDGMSLRGGTSHPRPVPVGAQSLDDIQARIAIPDDPSRASGLNNVNIEQEMAEAAKNQLRYQLAAQRIAGMFRALKTSITGRPA